MAGRAVLAEPGVGVGPRDVRDSERGCSRTPRGTRRGSRRIERGFDESFARQQGRFAGVYPQHVERRISALDAHAGGLIGGAESHRNEVRAGCRLEGSGEVRLEIGDPAGWDRDHQILGGAPAAPERQAHRQQENEAPGGPAW